MASYYWNRYEWIYVQNSNEAQTAATITSKGTLNLNGGTTSTRIYLHETYTDAYNYEVTNLEHNSGALELTPMWGEQVHRAVLIWLLEAHQNKIEPEGHV